MNHRAFTILELLVCVAVMAILVSLVLPGLAAARSRGRLAASLSGLRQVVAATCAYANDNREQLPFLATPRKPWEPIRLGGHETFPNSYFLQSRLVLSLLWPTYLSDRASLLPRLCEWCDELSEEVVYSRYWMSDTAFAEPAYWAEDTPPDSLAPYRGMRLGEAVFPSLKGLYLDRGASLRPLREGGGLDPWVVGRCDGSASTKAFDIQEYTDIPPRPYMATPWPVMFTRYGFSGRDF